MPERLAARVKRTRAFTVLMLCLTLGALGATLLAATPPTGTTPAGTTPAVDPAPKASEAAPVEPAGATTMPVLIASLYILVLAGFVGFEVIGGVSPLLHTPLMSVTNAISAISLVGSLVIAGSADYYDPLSRVLGLLAVTAAMINVVGGFMITDRMLRMFKLKEARS